MRCLSFLFNVVEDPMERANLKQRRNDVDDRITNLVQVWTASTSGHHACDARLSHPFVTTEETHMQSLLRLSALSVLILAYPLVGSAQAPQGVIAAQTPATATAIAVADDPDVLGAERLFSAWMEGKSPIAGSPASSSAW